jgi:hypothetical protein
MPKSSTMKSPAAPRRPAAAATRRWFCACGRLTSDHARKLRPKGEFLEHGSTLCRACIRATG